MTRFWPAQEPTQAIYERLRARALLETGGLGLASARFRRQGMAGLLVPAAVEAAMAVVVRGAERPRWSGRNDPRQEALGQVFGLLLRSTPSQAWGRAQ